MSIVGRENLRETYIDEETCITKPYESVRIKPSPSCKVNNIPPRMQIMSIDMGMSEFKGKVVEEVVDCSRASASRRKMGLKIRPKVLSPIKTVKDSLLGTGYSLNQSKEDGGNPPKAKANFISVQQKDGTSTEDEYRIIKKSEGTREDVHREDKKEFQRKRPTHELKILKVYKTKDNEDDFGYKDGNMKVKIQGNQSSLSPLKRSLSPDKKKVFPTDTSIASSMDEIEGQQNIENEKSYISKFDGKSSHISRNMNPTTSNNNHPQIILPNFKKNKPPPSLEKLEYTYKRVYYN